MDQAVENTDTKIWHSPDDMKSRTISMSKVGEAVTICCHGLCVTMPLVDLHALAVGDVEDRHEKAKNKEVISGEVGREWPPHGEL